MWKVFVRQCLWHFTIHNVLELEPITCIYRCCDILGATVVPSLQQSSCNILVHFGDCASYFGRVLAAVFLVFVVLVVIDAVLVVFLPSFPPFLDGSCQLFVFLIPIAALMISYDWCYHHYVQSLPFWSPNLYQSNRRNKENGKRWGKTKELQSSFLHEHRFIEAYDVTCPFKTRPLEKRGFA